MDIYNSKYSAEDLDNAIGALNGLIVPRVGDNGNWWIGNTDTGVFARGVDVIGGEVGQIVKIAEIDENGRPLAWEPADVTTSWDFINGIILQEDATETIINCDSNGNPFKYRSLRACVLSKNASDQLVTFVPIGSTGDTLWKAGEAPNAKLGSGTGCTVTHEAIGERIVWNSIALLSASYKEGWSYLTSGLHTQKEAYKYLTGYMISGTLAAGSVIEVYGYGKVTG